MDWTIISSHSKSGWDYGCTIPIVLLFCHMHSPISFCLHLWLPSVLLLVLLGYLHRTQLEGLLVYITFLCYRKRLSRTTLQEWWPLLQGELQYHKFWSPHQSEMVRRGKLFRLELSSFPVNLDVLLNFIFLPNACWQTNFDFPSRKIRCSLKWSTNMGWKTGKRSHMLYLVEVHRNADKGKTKCSVDSCAISRQGTLCFTLYVSENLHSA